MRAISSPKKVPFYKQAAVRTKEELIKQQAEDYANKLIAEARQKAADIKENTPNCNEVGFYTERDKDGVVDVLELRVMDPFHEKKQVVHAEPKTRVPCDQRKTNGVGVGGLCCAVAADPNQTLPTHLLAHRLLGSQNLQSQAQHEGERETEPPLQPRPHRPPNPPPFSSLSLRLSNRVSIEFSRRHRKRKSDVRGIINGARRQNKR